MAPGHWKATGASNKGFVREPWGQRQGLSWSRVSWRRGPWAAPAEGKQLGGEQRGGRGVELRGRWRRVQSPKGSTCSMNGEEEGHN